MADKVLLDIQKKLGEDLKIPDGVTDEDIKAKLADENIQYSTRRDIWKRKGPDGLQSIDAKDVVEMLNKAYTTEVKVEVKVEEDDKPVDDLTEFVSGLDAIINDYNLTINDKIKSDVSEGLIKNVLPLVQRYEAHDLLELFEDMAEERPELAEKFYEQSLVRLVTFLPDIDSLKTYKSEMEKIYDMARVDLPDDASDDERAEVESNKMSHKNFLLLQGDGQDLGTKLVKEYNVLKVQEEEARVATIQKNADAHAKNEINDYTEKAKKIIGGYQEETRTSRRKFWRNGALAVLGAAALFGVGGYFLGNADDRADQKENVELTDKLAEEKVKTQRSEAQLADQLYINDLQSASNAEEVQDLLNKRSYDNKGQVIDVYGLVGEPSPSLEKHLKKLGVSTTVGWGMDEGYVPAMPPTPDTN